ncbi:hypothetical protein [uncultured Jatrophihabitans sp.]|uniref:hypothetical protein n=1 Tax=uncultured Jatrophihabitans sp. TaxID=1610747 RepID=UPI0035C9B8AA
MAGHGLSTPGSRRRVDATTVLLRVYALFAVAAGARSTVQLSLHAGRAPLAYVLSAVAALVYAAGLMLLRRARAGGPTRPAVVCALVELAGVLGVGTASLLAPAGFPDATVWSGFGAGYLWIPLVLPLAALVRLRSWRV